MNKNMTHPSYSCELGYLSRPDGSAMFSEGDTTVIAGLYGPVEVKSQKVLIDKASVECNYRPKTGLPSVGDRLYESLIRNICETALVASLYPRTAILINLQEIHNDGQLISCAINSSCLACLDSGIDMKFMFAAVTCFLTKDNNFQLIPPISETSIRASFVFVFDSVEKRILASHTEGSFTKDQYIEGLNICREQSENVFLFFKSQIREIIF